MSSCLKNIRTKNYQNLIIGFRVTVENVGDVFETQCITIFWWWFSSVGSVVDASTKLINTRSG